MSNTHAHSFVAAVTHAQILNAHRPMISWLCTPLTLLTIHKCLPKLLLGFCTSLEVPKWLISRVGQNPIYTPYMTVYLVFSLPQIPYIHRLYMDLANPTHFLWILTSCALFLTACRCFCSSLPAAVSVSHCWFCFSLPAAVSHCLRAVSYAPFNPAASWLRFVPETA